jgi:hypothetical protein
MLLNPRDFNRLTHNFILYYCKPQTLRGLLLRWEFYANVDKSETLGYKNMFGLFLDGCDLFRNVTSALHD